MALLPLMYPTTSETAYLGGIAISMCTCRYGLFGRHLRETKRDGRRIRATDSGEYCTDGSASRGRGIAEFDLVLLAALHAGNLAVSRGGLSGGRALPILRIGNRRRSGQYRRYGNRQRHRRILSLHRHRPGRRGLQRQSHVHRRFLLRSLCQSERFFRRIHLDRLGRCSVRTLTTHFDAGYRKVAVRAVEQGFGSVELRGSSKSDADANNAAALLGRQHHLAEPLSTRRQCTLKRPC